MDSNSTTDAAGRAQTLTQVRVAHEQYHATKEEGLAAMGTHFNRQCNRCMRATRPPCNNAPTAMQHASVQPPTKV
eukprot:360783-Chlamydomonas_euryale.AAC.5